MLTFRNKIPSVENIAIIDDTNDGKNDCKILGIDSSAVDPPEEKQSIELVGKGETFSIYPTKLPERVLIGGSTGSGKSYIATTYSLGYNDLHLNNKIILFSPHENDENYKDVYNMVRVNLNDPEMFAEELDVMLFQNSLVIFDDCDSLEPAKKAFIDRLEKMLIMNARKYGTYVLSIVHMIRDGKATRHKISECSRCVIFPHGGGEYQSSEFLKTYCGFSKKLCAKVMAIKSRWLCVSNRYDKYILYDKGCVLVSKMNADLEKAKVKNRVIVPKKPLRYVETEVLNLDDSEESDEIILSD